MPLFTNATSDQLQEGEKWPTSPLFQFAWLLLIFNFSLLVTSERLTLSQHSKNQMYSEDSYYCPLFEWRTEWQTHFHATFRSSLTFLKKIAEVATCTQGKRKLMNRKTEFTWENSGIKLWSKHAPVMQDSFVNWVLTGFWLVVISVEMGHTRPRWWHIPQLQEPLVPTCACTPGFLGSMHYYILI